MLAVDGDGCVTSGENARKDLALGDERQRHDEEHEEGHLRHQQHKDLREKSQSSPHTCLVNSRAAKVRTRE